MPIESGVRITSSDSSLDRCVGPLLPSLYVHAVHQEPEGQRAFPKAPGHHNVGPQTERELKKVHGAIDQVRQTGDRHQDAENSSQEGRARADYILYYKYYKPSIPIALIEAGKTTTASATACSRPSTTRPQNSFCVFFQGRRLCLP